MYHVRIDIEGRVKYLCSKIDVEFSNLSKKVIHRNRNRMVDRCTMSIDDR